ncbi:3-(3-hydroxyphenyl)propionate hydroxylase, partial [Mycobacterium sp. ITM-2017-0098]
PFATISRPALGLRLVDKSMRVLAEFTRDTALSRNGFPQANMFDQPDFEELLRGNLANYASVEFRGDVEVTDVNGGFDGPVRVSYSDR